MDVDGEKAAFEAGRPDAIKLPADFFRRSEADRRRWIYGLRGPEPHGLSGRRRLLWIMDMARDPRAIGALTEIMERDPDVGVQRAALLALRGTRDRAAIPGLLLGLRSADPACRVHGIMGLEELKAREGVDDLISLLENTQRKDFVEMRVCAARALVAIRDERALEPLRAASKRGWPRSRRTLGTLADELAAALGY